MRNLFLIAIVLTLVSCAAGPVYVAKNEAEGIKSYYDDPKLSAVYSGNRGLLQELYTRFTRDKVSIYPQGLGVTSLSDGKGNQHVYLMVSIRPSEICFDQTSSKPNERFSQVLTTSYEKYLAYMKKEDLKGKDLEGLAFGIYWPARDFSQCDQYGGYIEYSIVYLSKDDFFDIKDGNKTFLDVTETTEIMASLEQKPAVSVKPVF
jgi:hypothetical protein